MTDDAPLVVTVPGVVLTAAESVVDAPMPSLKIDLSRYKWWAVAVLMAIGAGMRLMNWDLIWVSIAAVGLVFVMVAWAVFNRFVRARMGGEQVATRSGGQALDWRLDEVEVRQSGPFLELAVPWSGFVHVIDTPRAFVFAMTPWNVLVLPRRTLTPEQATNVRELIDRARDRGLIGSGPAEEVVDWATLRDAVAEKYAD